MGYSSIKIWLIICIILFLGRNQNTIWHRRPLRLSLWPGSAAGLSNGLGGGASGRGRGSWCPGGHRWQPASLRGRHSGTPLLNNDCALIEDPASGVSWWSCLPVPVTMAWWFANGETSEKFTKELCALPMCYLYYPILNFHPLTMMSGMDDWCPSTHDLYEFH